MLTGSSLVTSIWGAIGAAVLFVVILITIFRFFVGAQKNIPAGLAILAGVAFLAALAAGPESLLKIGETGKSLLGL